MAGAAELPLLYGAVEPLSSATHGGWRIRPDQGTPFLSGQHAVPVTMEEFGFVQRAMPIVFSVGAAPVPLVLMGLNEGVNRLVDGTGALPKGMYVPAYVRRYPFLLARLAPGSDELSLCFDPASRALGAFDEGEPLFVDGRPSDAAHSILAFNEAFEQAASRTTAFVAELQELDLLIEGEIKIEVPGRPQPFLYRGFQMVSEEKLRRLRGDQMRKMAASGTLPAIYAHLLSLPLVSTLFAGD